jgi:predicted transcriptional regulator
MDGQAAEKEPSFMRLDDIKRILDCEVLTPEMDLSMEVHAALASDGMSEILAFHLPDALMITGLTNIQSVRTADIADVRGIVYIRGKKPNDKVIELARQKRIPLLVTHFGMFDACGILRERGMKGAM